MDTPNAIIPPTTAPLFVPPISRAVDVSPDGSHLVYWSSTAAGRQLMVRSVATLSATELEGDISGEWDGPFISDDSAWVGYYAEGALKRVSVLGGPSVTIAPAPWSRGGSWVGDTIILGTAAPGGLFRVAVGGGEPEVLTSPDSEQGEGSHAWPDILPGGRAVLFTILPASPAQAAQIALLDLDTGIQRVLIPGGSHPRYVPSGHVVYGVDGTLRAVGFDLERLEVTTDPVPVLDGVITKPSGAADFSVSRDGSLVYVPGAAVQGAGSSTLVWVDREGNETPLDLQEERSYGTPRLSPDGERLAVTVEDQNVDVWASELARGTLRRLTTDPSVDANPIWTPDGERVVFASQRT